MIKRAILIADKKCSTKSEKRSKVGLINKMGDRKTKSRDLRKVIDIDLKNVTLIFFEGY